MGSGSKLVRAVESTINLRMIYFHYSTIGDGAPCVINYCPPLFFSSTFSLEILRVRRAYIFLIFPSFSSASGRRAKNPWEAPDGLWETVLLPVPGTVPKVDLPR
jgi:hypothetical protein